MDKWFKDILPDKDPYHNRGRDQIRKKGSPEFDLEGEIIQLHSYSTLPADVHEGIPLLSKI